MATEHGDVRSAYAQASADRPTDFELVRLAQKGDAAAFHGLVDRYARFLYSLAMSLTSSAADAEDLVQETLAGAFRGLGSFEGRSSLKTWLARILVRQNARRHRQRGGRPAVVSLEAAAEVEAPAGGSQAATEARLDIMAAIRALGPEHREVVVLREIEGLSYDEMAEVLDVPRGTVESRLFRARRQLQVSLKEYLE